jgi:F0F1-type ATP synthase assembly protein I
MFWLKAVISGLLIAAASEAGRRSPAAGGMLSALPLVSAITLIWLWRGGAEPAEMIRYSVANFWFVLPTLPMFLVIAGLLRTGWGFWPAFAVGCALTVVLYLGTMWVLARFGVQL